MGIEENLGDGRGNPSPLELLTLDIDTRIPALWREVVEVENWDLETVA